VEMKGKQVYKGKDQENVEVDQKREGKTVELSKTSPGPIT
jgi:hypothetical protein